MRLIFPASRLLWAAPCSALGLMLCSAALLSGGQLRWRAGALECCLKSDSDLMRWLDRHQPFAAITLGHVIFALRAEDLQRWHAHERVHVKQFERWGALLLLAYPLASLWAWLKGEDAYLANCFEQEAYRLETTANS
ncbi:signal peptide prediction [Variovorax sp. PCZ-1]|uniref:signal peptide prediction n=1 Tax=Variovorax sp. PCZ-1 TaxID=2835533 RepID=UPI0020C0826F|nr:signal peptide prediction [Variovorax sp. PCZ-1]